MGGLRGQEILIIVILLIIVFGWKKLPDAARSLGRSARVFKSEVEEMKKDGKEGAADGTVQSEASGQAGHTQPVIPPPPAQFPAPQSQEPQYQQPQSPQPQSQQPQYQQPQSQQPQRPEPQSPDDPTRPVA